MIIVDRLYPMKFTQSLISQLPVVVSRQQVALWNSLIELYRLVVVSRHNTHLLGNVSTRSIVLLLVAPSRPAPRVSLGHHLSLNKYLRILACSCRIKALSGVLESSH
jgi:hypothetical protein